MFCLCSKGMCRCALRALRAGDSKVVEDSAPKSDLLGKWPVC